MPWFEGDGDGERDFVALPARPVKFTVNSTQDDLDAGFLSATIHFTPITDEMFADAATKIATSIDRKMTRALIGFHAREGRWPAWAWVEDWRSRRMAFRGIPRGENPDEDLTALPIPDVDCGDVCPDESYTTATYRSGILNERPDLAVTFFAKAAELEGLEV